MPEVDEEHAHEGEGKSKGAASTGAPPGAGTSSGNQNDGRAWGRADEEGEVMELLTTLSEGGHRGGEETLIGAGDIGDAIGRRRRQEERMFLEVCLDEHSLWSCPRFRASSNVSRPWPHVCVERTHAVPISAPFQRLQTDSTGQYIFRLPNSPVEMKPPNISRTHALGRACTPPILPASPNTPQPRVIPLSCLRPEPGSIRDRA